MMKNTENSFVGGVALFLFVVLGSLRGACFRVVLFAASQHRPRLLILARFLHPSVLLFFGNISLLKRNNARSAGTVKGMFKMRAKAWGAVHPMPRPCYLVAGCGTSH